MKKGGMLKKAVAFALLTMMLCLTACQSDQEAIYSRYTAESPGPVSGTVHPDADRPPESQPEESGGEEKGPKKDLSGELTISELFDIPGHGTNGIVEAFQKEYPNVKITVNYGIPDGQEITSEAVAAYDKRLATELMSGQAADILSYSSGEISAKDIARNGYAINLYEWMDSDPEFHREDYFQNLFESLEYDGALYQFPVLFLANVIYLNFHITDALGYTFEPWDEINYETVLSIYNKAEKKGLLGEKFTLSYMDMATAGQLFLVTSLKEFFDEDTGTAHFDSPEYIKYLESTKSLPTHRKQAAGANSMSGGMLIQEFANSNLSENTSLVLSTSISMSEFPGMIMETEGATPPLLLVSQSHGATFTSGVQYMISSSCEKPELAWEFLKFAAGPIDNPGYYTALEGRRDFSFGSLQIHRGNFRAFSKLYAQVDDLSRKDPDN